VVHKINVGLVYMDNITFERLVGLDDSHLVAMPAALDNGSTSLAPGTAAAFSQLVLAAQEVGIALSVVSGYRSFERQLLIWNAKARGLRPIYSDSGQLLDAMSLNERDRVFAILRWSALPGASRHHWGTDIDVCDQAAMPEGYQLQLSVAECQAGGVFHDLHRWLDWRLGEATAMGFTRPFERDSGGVAPEPWHLSYLPEAIQFEVQCSREAFRDFIMTQPIALKQTVLLHFDEICERFLGF
jgi:LAS superfamily LD-carboxypeptidase LdcB